MGKTIAEKVLSRVAGKDSKSGDFVWAVPDLIYIHDILGPLVLESLRKMGTDAIKFKNRLVFINDHAYPPKDLDSAQNSFMMKKFATEHGVELIGDGEGIEHTLLIEKGYVKEGMFVIGSDSHTVTSGAAGAMGVGLGSTDIAAILALNQNWFMVPETMRFDLGGKPGKFITGKDIILEILRRIGVDGANYKSMEIGVSKESGLHMDDRLAIANMTVEAGAKDGVLFDSWKSPEPENALPDVDAKYTSRDQISIDVLTPKIALPFSPGNVHDISSAEGVPVNQVYIGNCSNGTLSDLREAASVLKGNTVKEGVRTIVVPATRGIYRQALKEGLIEIFLDAGATVAPSTCGACGGIHMGVLAKEETAISNTNRNFHGRMGHPQSRVYLANSYVAALAAVEGRITDPEVAI